MHTHGIGTPMACIDGPVKIQSPRRAKNVCYIGYLLFVGPPSNSQEKVANIQYEIVSADFGRCLAHGASEKRQPVGERETGL
jgi:hypothetical protein